ncbi:hypothetical protein HKCCSP123_02180 [Rhodobacterales bacterium HKCCSP123]|nr:hypothetical protein [Rhodobacterales bacterium HKCCSP123]
MTVAAPGHADPALVAGAEATLTGAGWRFDVTILHPETGWDDYADGWRVETPDGRVLGERPLAHPHVNEQPFTRSLSGVAIPEGLDRVAIRARTSVEGWGDETLLLTLRAPP